MICVEASNIYLGGGYILLEQFLRTLESRGLKAKVYVGYATVYKRLLELNFKNISVLKTSGLKTVWRYLFTHSNTLYFCNLPPFTKTNKSVLYVHNPYVLKKRSLLDGNLKYLIYYYWIKMFANNVSTIACQTSCISSDIEKLGYRAELLPFYVPTEKKKMPCLYDFCYISTVSPHKNHIRLLDAVEFLVRKGVNFKIALTVRKSEENRLILDKINSINNLASTEVIINKGFVSRLEVENILNSSRCLVFPSLMETFGLPIAEALMVGLKVIASDRPYVYDVMSNPIVFDPLDVQSIAHTLENELNHKFCNVEQSLLVNDKIDSLINKLLI